MKNLLSNILTVIGVLFIIYTIVCFGEIFVKSGNAMNVRPVYSEWNYLVNMTK